MDPGLPRDMFASSQAPSLYPPSYAGDGMSFAPPPHPSYLSGLDAGSGYAPDPSLAASRGHLPSSAPGFAASSHHPGAWPPSLGESQAQGSGSGASGAPTPPPDAASAPRVLPEARDLSSAGGPSGGPPGGAQHAESVSRLYKQMMQRLPAPMQQKITQQLVLLTAKLRQTRGLSLHESTTAVQQQLLVRMHAVLSKGSQRREEGEAGGGSSAGRGAAYHQEASTTAQAQGPPPSSQPPSSPSQPSHSAVPLPMPPPVQLPLPPAAAGGPTPPAENPEASQASPQALGHRSGARSKSGSAGAQLYEQHQSIVRHVVNYWASSARPLPEATAAACVDVHRDLRREERVAAMGRYSKTAQVLAQIFDRRALADTLEEPLGWQRLGSALRQKRDREDGEALAKEDAEGAGDAGVSDDAARPALTLGQRALVRIVAAGGGAEGLRRDSQRALREEAAAQEEALRDGSRAQGGGEAEEPLSGDELLLGFGPPLLL